MLSINEPVLRMAIETFGEEAQTVDAVGAMGELIAALTSSKKPDSDRREAIAEVMIMCSQLAIIYGSEHVKTQVRIKLRRLEERVTEDP